MSKGKIEVGWTEKGSSDSSQAGRDLLKNMLLGIYQIDLSAEHEPIQKEEGGKPFLIHHRKIHFNISHSGEYIICGIGEVPLGIDIQYHKKGDHRKTGKRIMTPKEWEIYEASGFREEIFFRYWTKKESYLKYTGEGLRRKMRELEYQKCAFYDLNRWHGYSAMLCVPEQWKGRIVTTFYPSAF